VDTEQEKLFRGKAERVNCYKKDTEEIMEWKVTVVVQPENYFEAGEERKMLLK
jgi:hypothetical protein